MAQLEIIHLQCGRPRFHPWVGKIPWWRELLPLQYSALENSRDCIVHEVTKRWTRLSDFHFYFHIKLLLFWSHFYSCFIKSIAWSLRFCPVFFFFAISVHYFFHGLRLYGVVSKKSLPNPRSSRISSIIIL